MTEISRQISAHLRRLASETRILWMLSWRDLMPAERPGSLVPSRFPMPISSFTEDSKVSEATILPLHVSVAAIYCLSQCAGSRTIGYILIVYAKNFFQSILSYDSRDTWKHSCVKTPNGPIHSYSLVTRLTGMKPLLQCG